MTRRRISGSTRKLPSGMWQARTRDLDGRLIAIGTFFTKAESDRALSLALADQTRGGWIDPKAGQIRLGEYAAEWLDSRPRPLRPRTRELYEGLIRIHIVPSLGQIDLAKLTTSRVRSWNAEMIAAGRGEAVTARTYRLLRAILNTAIEDELIVKNPCVIKGAGAERSPERPVATIPQVFALADAVPARFRALVLTAAFTSLREAELFALTRASVDLLHRTVTVSAQLHSLRNGKVIIGPPKTEAGFRTVALPEALVSELESHLGQYAAAGRDALVFCGAKGAPLRRSYWGRKWRAATLAVGMPKFHFHDLRHTGNTLAAATGASTKELMARMGHASPRAALIYQHATLERDHVIAKALSDMMAAAYPEDSGEVVALRQEGGASDIS